MSRLIIKNLPKRITEEKLQSLFSQKGDITDIQLKYTSDGVFRQFAFIGYRTEEQADDCIKFFNGTFINTNKITVQKCSELGDVTKPKSWSKYAPDSTQYQKEHKSVKESPKDKEEAEENAQTEKKSKIKELVEKYKDDPMFEEFMQLHGTLDINAVLSKLEESEKKIGPLIRADREKQDEDGSENETAEEGNEKIANEKISDLEYMKLLMTKSVEKKPKKKDEKKPKNIKLYTVKLHGLPYACKKKQIKDFLRPLKPFTIRIARNIKGIAYIGFKTEKETKQALNKSRSFISGHRILVSDYIKKEMEENSAVGTEKKIKSRWISQEESLKNEEDIAESGQIFLRNLSYTVTEDDIQELFSKYGQLSEINIPIDKFSRKSKGYGIITFLMPEHAVKAYTELDGTILQGRMLHLLPGKSKDTVDIDNLEGVTYKEKKEMKDKAQAGSSHNWNTLFMGHNAVAEVIADTYGTTKDAILNDTGKGSAAVRLALGETQLVAQTKHFLENNGVHLDAFNKPSNQRSKTIILVKNLPALTESKEIQSLFAPHGLLGRVILPPSGITALVEFLEPSEARKAFTKLAYSKFKNGPLYLEWAPENVLKAPPTKSEDSDKTDDNKQAHKGTTANEEQGSSKKPTGEENKKEGTKLQGNKDEKSSVDKEEEDDEEEEEEPESDTTLFVKNLNFKTTEDSLRKHFESCGKLRYVTVAMKKHPENPGQKLSMGYGFVRYQKKAAANKALISLQASTLDGKSLEIKRSGRVLNSDVKSTKKTSIATKQTGTKLLVKNVPFQAKRKELYELFKTFGEIKALRLPMKLTLSDESHRGFAFVDYVTKSDAKKAFEALSGSTHLYGRRLNIEWAATEEGVEEIRKRTSKRYFSGEGGPVSKKASLDAESFINS